MEQGFEPTSEHLSCETAYRHQLPYRRLLGNHETVGQLLKYSSSALGQWLWGPGLFLPRRQFATNRPFVLEGIVAKRKGDPYLPEHASWLKIKNRVYSQWIGREELFERERASDPDWHHHWNTCEACDQLIEA